MKTTYIWVIVIIVILALGFWGWSQGWFGSEIRVSNERETDTPTEVPTGDEDPSGDEGALVGPEEKIGTSAGGRDIMAYHYGEGDTEILFVGGIHAGYGWNTVLVARELMAYLERSPDVIPENLKVTVIPVLNPDGLFRTAGTVGVFGAADIAQGSTVAGRFNANNVDLNRNFDCVWQSEGVWQDRTVDGGDVAFSEPESKALRDYVLENRPEGAVIWYSAVGGVFASSCQNGVSTGTKTLMDVYAKASGYSAHDSYDFYEITGDAANWMAKVNIPTISVVLTTHQSVEWDKNKMGVEAVLDHYGR